MLEEERETEREEAAELEVGETLPVPGEQVPFSDTSIIYFCFVEDQLVCVKLRYINLIVRYTYLTIVAQVEYEI